MGVLPHPRPVRSHTVLAAIVLLSGLVRALQGSNGGRHHFTVAPPVTMSNSYTTPMPVDVAHHGMPL